MVTDALILGAGLAIGAPFATGLGAGFTEGFAALLGADLGAGFALAFAAGFAAFLGALLPAVLGAGFAAGFAFILGASLEGFIQNTSYRLNFRFHYNTESVQRTSGNVPHENFT
jgi:hypothetical protein